MQKDIIIVDNFYKDPDAVVRYAKKQKYYYPYQDEKLVRSGEKKPFWSTSRFKDKINCPFRSSEELITKLEQITGDTIEKAYWDRDLEFQNTDEEEDFFNNFVTRKIEILNKHTSSGSTQLPSDFQVSLWNGSFHIKTDWDQSEAIHNHINDYWQCCGELGWNGIIYLNKTAPERRGIKFWSHKFDNNQEWMSSHERWNMIDDLGNVYNRLILFRGKTPHSGAPGFGETAEDGRLFQTFFFRTTNPKTLSPVSIRL